MKRPILKNISQDTRLNLLLLLVWIVLGASLRLAYLGDKTPSTIELATLVFSLGNRLKDVLLDQAIALDTLLQPLQINPTANINNVAQNLISESTHPPLYFMLTHLWLKLLPSDGNLGSLWAGRTLSALFGIVSIPAIFGLGHLAFRSRVVAHLAAALMAVSPYGIYVAQEARHYTLTILWSMASFACLILALRCLNQKTTTPVWLGWIWIGINGLGMACHYFFVLILGAEGLVILGFWLSDYRLWLLSLLPSSQENQTTISPLQSKPWQPIYLTALGTAVTGLMWLPVVKRIPNDNLTQWIQTDFDVGELLIPLVRILGWIITMVFMVPLEGQGLSVTIASVCVLLLFLSWSVPAFIRGGKCNLTNPSTQLATKVFGGFVLGAIAIFLVFPYGLGIDLTLAARYHFVYFPALIVLLGAALASCWQEQDHRNLTKPFKISNVLQVKGKKGVGLVIIASLVGALTVVFNLGYQKSRRADLLVPQIQSLPDVPVLIATKHNTHSDTRALMAIAWEFHHLNQQLTNDVTTHSPQFLLAHDTEQEPQLATQTLKNTLVQLPRPLEVWTINFSPDIDWEAHYCRQDSRPRRKVNGYRYRSYHCNK